MTHNFNETGLYDDSEMLVIIPSESKDTMLLLELDSLGEGYEAEIEVHLGGWPEEAELDTGSRAEEIGATVWVNADALGADLNELATLIVGYDIYGPAVIAKTGNRGKMLGLTLEDLDTITLDLDIKLKAL